MSASGDNTIIGTGAGEHLNGGSGNDTINADAGADFVNGGSGNDILDGGAGSDTVSGDSGDDLLIYRASENVGATDIYDGGSGIDTLRLDLTSAQWFSAGVQNDVANYLQFISSNTLPNGQAKNTEFHFTSFDLSVSKVEQLAVTVDGVAVNIHAPVVVADTNGADAVVEAGVNSGNVPFAGDPSAAGNVLANDFDPDSYALTVSGVSAGTSAGPVSGNVGAAVAGTYGTLTLGANGSWSYGLNNGDADTNALAQGETAQDVFTYTASDGHGGFGTTTLTVNLTGTNDKPVITGGATTGSVKEDQAITQATGQLTVVDPDHNATQTWTVVGGTASANADYHFLADRFTVTKGTGAGLITVLDDDFSDGNPPPASPPLNPNGPNTAPTTYAGLGSFTESGGKLHLDSNNAVSFVGVGTPDPIIGENAIVRTNIDPTNPNLGLKQNATFDVTGVFDLVLPDSPREAYGIRLTDRLIGGPGTPPDQPGNDVIELIVRENLSGQVVVSLRRLDFATDVTTNLQSITLNPPAGTDQIQLHLNHVANSPTVSASFDYLQGGVVVGSQTFSNHPTIFNGENWTRAEIVAYAPAQSDSILSGNFGTLNIGQSGAWTYALDNSRTATQNLAEGQHATDTFTVQVKDQYGAFDTKTINIDVVGSNDAPIVLTGPVTRALTEDSAVNGAGNLTATGLAQFSDLDLTDTHVASVALQSTTGFVPPSLMPLLNGALTASVGPETGDGHGEVTWNFALDNSQLQYLAEGQTLTLDYHVIVTDPFGATSFQDVKITITGTNDAPVIDVADEAESASITENAGVTNDLTNHHLGGQIHFSDPDLADHLTGSLAGQTYTYTAADGQTALTLTPDQISALFSDFQFNNIPGTPNPGFVSWTFDAQDNQFDFLAEGEKIVLTSTIQVSDGHGGSDTATVAVTITGTNDAPSIVAAVGDSAGQTLDETNAGLTATGTLTALDPDVSDTITASVVGLTHSGPTGNLSDGDLLSYFSVTSGTIIDNTHTSGQLTWDFNSGSEAFDYLAPGETLTLHYTIRPDDAHNPPASGDGVVTIIINGTNDGPVAFADTNAGDPVVESGVAVGGNTPFAGDPSAAGNVLANDTDVDDGASLSVTTTGDFTGTYGTLHLDLDGSYTYTLNNGDADTNALAQGESASDVFNYTIADGQGGTSSSTLTIGITGTNDQPVITAGPTTGSVKEDTTNSATGQLIATDPDHGAQKSWSVVGGSGAANADYHFRVDTFTVTGAVPGGSFTDTFSDGNPPPSAPNFGNGAAASYVTTGGFTETGGELHIDSNNAVSVVNVGNPDPLIGNIAILRTNIDPSLPAQGLKLATNFTVSGVFDLVTPDSPRETYGIRLTDRLVGGPGNPPDQLGDNTYDLVVRENPAGVNLVTLRHIDFATNVTTNVQSFALAPPPGADQIKLVFTHVANSTDVTASFQYLSGGVVIGTTNFGSTAPIFAPGSTDTEIWTRAAIVTYAPATSDSLLSGNYGTLDIDQTGTWTYNLDNSRIVTQNLAEGQHATDTFTVQVADQYGAIDTKTISVDVVGTNDAPTMQTPAVSRALTEDSGVNGSGNLTATGLAQFADVDLTDTHALSATLQSAVLSDGGSLPAGLQALLDAAVTTSFNDDSNGDGHGELQWNFDLSNSAVQFLAQGETLTLHYNVTVTDPFGAAATQDVGITITGVDDAPFVIASAPSNDLTEQGGSVAGTATSVVNLSIGDVDSIASYDTTGWTSIDATHWSKTGTYGSAVLDTSANTLTYTLANGDPDTDALSTGQTVHDDFTVGVHEDNGALTGTASVSFAIDGTTDAGPVKVAVVYNSTTVGASALAAQLNDDTYFDFQATVVRFDQVDSAAELSNYDVVIDAQSYFESGSEQYYAALKDWVAADEGGVVTTDWFSYKMNGNGLSSTQLANADFITPIAANHNGWGYSDATVFTVNASHPITQGVTSLATTVNQYQWTATPLIDADAVSLATYSGNSNGFNNPSWSGVAYKDIAGMGHEVYLGGFYSDASYRDADVQHGPADQLLEQAVHWAASHDALML